MNKGSLILIPTMLGEGMRPEDFLGRHVFDRIKGVKYFLVENEKNARRFLKMMFPDVALQELELEILNKKTHPEEIKNLLLPVFQGNDIGLLSDAGCPGIADPGGLAVSAAHHLDIRVEPLVGPSSILLALIASGMNGQNFAFNGYLPIDKSERKKALIELERKSQHGQTQLFMETPYRNMALLEDVLKTLKGSTKLCIACELTLPGEQIKTQTVSEWRTSKINLNKRPCIFGIGG